MTLSVNDRTILQLIETRQATSQVHLARLLGLPPNTVHGVIQRLIASDLIESQRVESHGRGRPIQHYQVRNRNPVLVIRWLGSVWNAGVFRSGILLGRTQTLNSPVLDSVDAMLPWLKKLRDITLHDLGMAPRDLSGAVVVVNSVKVGQSHDVVSSVVPWIRGLSESTLESLLGCKTKLTLGLQPTEAELRAWTEEGIKSLIVFNVGDGVSGHGICVDPLWGVIQEIPGEIGHVSLSGDGPVCGCGNRGCLEASISGPALMRRLLTDLQNGVQTRLAEVAGQSPRVLFDKIDELDSEGTDSYARSLAEFVVEKAGWAVSTIVNLLAPDLIVLSGYGLHGRAHWRERILRQAMRTTLHASHQKIRLEFSRLSSDAVLAHFATCFADSVPLEKRRKRRAPALPEQN